MHEHDTDDVAEAAHVEDTDEQNHWVAIESGGFVSCAERDALDVFHSTHSLPKNAVNTPATTRRSGISKRPASTRRPRIAAGKRTSASSVSRPALCKGIYNSVRRHVVDTEEWNDGECGNCGSKTPYCATCGVSFCVGCERDVCAGMGML